MSKIVVVGANHAGTACINTMLDNFGNENEIVVFDQNSNISFQNFSSIKNKSILIYST
nr:MAG TPA: Amine oxidase [Caudoviricetes sp.]